MPDAEERLARAEGARELLKVGASELWDLMRGRLSRFDASRLRGLVRALEIDRTAA
jgi:hypothetical protein